MINEKIELAVKFELEYSKISERNFLIEKAKEHATASSTKGFAVKITPIEAIHQPPLKETLFDFVEDFYAKNYNTNGLTLEKYINVWLRKYKKKYK